MHRVSSDFIPCLVATAQGALPEGALRWNAEPSVCVVIAASGYPEDPHTGDAITGLDDLTHAIAFHAGTKLVGNTVVTSGGRVLGVTANGPSLKEATSNAYAGVRKIHFEGMQYRTDIGQKGLKRW